MLDDVFLFIVFSVLAGWHMSLIRVDQHAQFRRPSLRNKSPQLCGGHWKVGQDTTHVREKRRSLVPFLKVPLGVENTQKTKLRKYLKKAEGN